MATGKLIAPDFFDRPAPVVARELLGMLLCVGDRCGVVTETEAYQGEEDDACHARFGRTKRSETLYAAPGTLYVYLCYGMHWMLNIVTGKENFPAAVLIRGIAPCIHGGKSMSLNGPGKVTKYFGVDKSFNGQKINGSRIVIERHSPPDDKDIIASPRIGIDFAKEPWRSRPWRFIIRKRPPDEVGVSSGGR